MAILYLTVLLFYYQVTLKGRVNNGSILARILWGIYFILGLSAAFIELTNGISPIFEPNYWSVLVLLTGILLSISGFLGFRKQYVLQMPNCISSQNSIEFFLIISQLLSIVFFLPFAAMSLIGDQNENRLLIGDKIELLGSYGLLNTFAGAACQLFSASLIFAFMRLRDTDRNIYNIHRAYALIFSSLSYVVYILAYVGRDGVVYWVMNYFALYFLFKDSINIATKKKMRVIMYIILAMLLIPFVIITISRFSNAQISLGWSLFEYFGAQIINFSDFSSIDRPLTHGVQNFPMFFSWACEFFGVNYIGWSDLRDPVFQIYLNQGKAPWVFGTFVSDFVGDFGEAGALLLLSVISLLTSCLCSIRKSYGYYTLPRFLLIFFIFLIPYWGVFYFRFSIVNGYIVVNLLFIFVVYLMNCKRRSRPC